MTPERPSFMWDWLGVHGRLAGTVPRNVLQAFVRGRMVMSHSNCDTIDRAPEGSMRQSRCTAEERTATSVIDRPRRSVDNAEER